LVGGPGESGAKTAQMRAPFDGIDVVGEGKNVFAKTVVILKGALDLDIIFLLVDRANLGVKRDFIAV
jgi:hypothetical protein